MMAKAIQGLYYITHIDNLPSILQHGILSHQRVEELQISYEPIYDRDIVSNRRMKRVGEDGNTLWYYANFYFQPRNPMMYRVKESVSPRSIVVLKLKRTLLDRPDIWVTDGNAANQKTQIARPKAERLAKIAQQIDREYWTDTDDAKRQIMAECLVPEAVPPSEIECVYISRNGEHREKVQAIVEASGQRRISVVVEPNFFFQPRAQWSLTDRLYLAQGDMFFSKMQTLTISVNTKGVMGKGLASRTRYQFPDVYVHYEDACKAKHLTTKTPVLYKRTRSLAADLSEGGLSVNDPSETWFLLFATKEHWKENSKLSYIVDGMAYVLEKYREWGISSLALPALGCGLGGLSWAEVGPIMCRTAQQMSIPVCIYLPAEVNIPEAQLKADFLLRS